jgi:hypothetical protein
MTQIQKALVAGTVALLLEVLVHERFSVRALQARLKELQQSQSVLAERNRQLQAEVDEASLRGRLQSQAQQSSSENREVLRLRAEVTLLRTEAGAARSNTNEVQSWLALVDGLKDAIRRSPEHNIPEFQFMTDEAWVMSSRLLASGWSEFGYTNGIKFAQGCAKMNFAKALSGALQKYLADHAGEFPSDCQQLQPYLDRTTDAAVFGRYEVIRARLVSVMNPGGSSVHEEYQTPPAPSTAGSPDTGEWVIMQKAPLYAGDAKVVIAKTGVHLQ